MISLLVTSKTMDMEPVQKPPPPDWSTPVFKKEASALNRALTELNVDQLKEVMGISDALAVQTRERIKAFSSRPGTRQLQAAALAFTGDVYTGLDARSFRVRDFSTAQKHLRILSGLYGLLRPLDGIQAYRLEPGYRWQPPGDAKTLRAFWKPRITKQLKSDLKALPAKQRILVNLASAEFTAMVDFTALEVPVITPVFKERKQGALKTVTLYTKRARGAFAGFLVRNRIVDPAAAKDFEEDGYQFDSDASTDWEWCFTREGN